MFEALDIPEHLQAPSGGMRNTCMAEIDVDEKYINASKNGNIPDNIELKC